MLGGWVPHHAGRGQGKLATLHCIVSLCDGRPGSIRHSSNLEVLRGCGASLASFLRDRDLELIEDIKQRNEYHENQREDMKPERNIVVIAIANEQMIPADGAECADQDFPRHRRWESHAIRSSQHCQTFRFFCDDSELMVSVTVHRSSVSSRPVDRKRRPFVGRRETR